MRLIDADRLQLRINLVGTNKFGMLDEDIRKFVDEIPTVDAALVVRCKDCKYYGEYDCIDFHLPYCRPDDFCSFGMRKDGGNDVKG